MTRDIETAVATVIGACMGLEQLAKLSHSRRPLHGLQPGTLSELERALATADRLAHDERLHLAREALTGRAA